MNHYVTEIRALDPLSGRMKIWCGPNVPALNYAEADRYCQENGLGYCMVVGELIEEIDFETGAKVIYKVVNRYKTVQEKLNAWHSKS